MSTSMSKVVLTQQMVLDKSKLSTMPEVRHLDLWGAGLTDVSIVAKLENIQVLAFAANSIASLKPFGSCAQLEELYLRKNRVANLKEIAHLRGLRKLHTLWLTDNPCAKVPFYREFVLHCCGSLKQLDSVEVTAEERAAAAKALTTRAIDEILGKAPAAREPASSSPQPSPASQTPSPRHGRSSSSGSAGNMIEELNASGKTVLLTTVQAQRAMLTAIVSLLPELTVDSLELLEREVHSRVERQRQNTNKLSQAERSGKQ